MTTKDLVDILHDYGIRANIEEDQVNHFIRITTDEAVPEKVRERIESMRPVSLSIHFITKQTKKVPVPRGLEKWYKEAVKASK